MLYVVMVHGSAWDEVIGITTDVETARHIVHQRQTAQDEQEKLMECEHVAVHVMEPDRYYPHGA